MALVDYSSSDDGSASADESLEPPNKRPKRENVTKEDSGRNTAPPGNSASSMPPLPASFFDLYASTVRQSIKDDPTLHQGRRRQTPHIAGHWPSHVYVEWHPSQAQHGSLEKLLKNTREMVGTDVELHSFLTSELGTQLPLHISLSRPLSLTTADKDSYLDKIRETISTGVIAPFVVRPVGLAWYKSPDSERTFFVLRTEEALHTAETKNGKAKANPSLMNLLAKCNRTAVLFGEPPLYQRKESTRADEHAHGAFHISIGWTLGSTDEETCIKVLQLFKNKEFRQIRNWEVEVTGIKVKIGNTISHVSLATRHEKRGSESLDSFY